MNKIKKYLARLDNDQNPAYMLIRIFLGIVLFVRGWILAANPDAIIALVGEQQLHIWFSYLTIGHLLGGLSIALGIFARLGSLLQIPILFTAVIMVHSQNGIMTGDQSLELASLVLFLLVIILIFGSGRWSLDRYFHI